MMEGRNLRVLVINDQEVSLDALMDLVDVASFTNFDGIECYQISTWQELLWLFQEGEIPDFDLLVDDIQFDRDSTAPNWLALAPQTPNPFGLVYALPLAGRTGLTKMPFVWAIHSQGPTDVADNPVAILVYGLLCAMQASNDNESGATLFQRDNPQELVERYKKRLSNEPPVRNPESVVLRLVKRYRDAFRDACDSKRAKITLDGDNLYRLRDLCQKAGQQNDPKALGELEKAALELLTNDTRDSLNLRSLFADFEDWNRSTINSGVGPFLKNLIDIHESLDQNYFERVEKVMKELEINDDSENPTVTADEAIKRIVGGPDHRLGVGVILCAYLRLKRGKVDREPTLTELLVFLGCYKDGQDGKAKRNDQWPNRQIKKMIREDLTSREFLRELATRPLKQRYLVDCGRNYCRQVLGWSDKEKNRPWPLCIRPT